MENYYLLDTWNGQGYSDSGIIDIVDTIEEAQEKAWLEFKDRYMQTINPSFGEGHHVVIFDDEGMLYADEKSNDSGKITILKGNFYGIYINPNLNECVGMNEDEYNEMMKFLTKNYEDKDEFESFKEELSMNGNAGVHTDEGYYIIYKL